MGNYVFESDDTLTRRHLGALEGAFDAVSIRRLDESGVRAGWKCLDAGAGSGSIARWLADRVGSSGEVVATDTDLRLLEGVQGGNIRVLEHDLTRDPLPEAEYDLVHARLLLILLTERDRVLDRLIGALKPGGVLVLEDFDVAGSGTLLAPEDGDAEVFDRVLEAYLTAMAAAGVDNRWGRHLYAALRYRGLHDVRSVGRTEAWPGGSPGCELIRANLVQLRRRILDQGTVSPGEWERAVELLGDEKFAMRSFLLVSNTGLR
ncbi:class I SAM-dependent methyltransferase [Haloactinomyces albus]|uniref:SAM-dependent methyltransferase n=1 Tax=Haloactinomyces albus TaxID=1352928 RepID=A0AAE3ZCZ5_9ACTN|nr:methyltransferase domain-containing protein [Haloactinomyces albus]MDR7300824.1 SAM-dependent methyltransferase [Haloactinomyces albus]